MKNDTFSRRDFMRNTSLVAAGTIAGGSQGRDKPLWNPCTHRRF